MSVRRAPFEIHEAVEMITKDNRHREMRCLERRTDSRLPFQRAVQVIPLSDDENGPQFELKITAYTRDISRNGIGIIHDEPIPGSRVVLKFELLGGETVQLIVDFTWCRYLGDFWYSSGGRLTGVVSK